MKLLIFTSCLCIWSCASTTSKRPENIHPDMDIKDVGAENQSKPATEIKPATVEDVFAWQKVFKGPPSAKDRDVLQQTLKKLKGATSPQDLMKRGRNEFSLGLLAAAESSFREVLRADAKNIDALIELATTLHRQRKVALALDVLAEARSYLSALEKTDSGQVFRYRYALAMTYLASDDRSRAHAILSDLIGKDKTFLPGYSALAYSYLKDGKDSVARFIVDQALDRGGDHPSLYNILGILAERSGKNPLARDHYNKALELSDSYAPALVNRGNLYINERQLGMAETDFKRAVDADPANIDAMIGLGVVQRQSGRFAIARSTFERVIEIDADNPQARFNLAVLFRENTNEPGIALRYFNEVTQSERANPSLKAMAKGAIEEIRSL